ncbi:MAG TPA: UDP-N-acetylglucosamine 1-carboxyvinyltransferase [Gammaproteobacteria bacterium]|nr:UDP-N-acetylglucosamine 1-carboxyvinyltransferase [Xanthomonadales bacterium]MCB1595138.1 UDP-N-acetylglucosamine 1-carboxyvinyltransferase [Xanthomonadales bacterium]HOP22040.1 UDP-N-acetylglucosamine 1-carboxyvinyltransferase [Gammaproteobacteria bacterium]HPI95340.1 UDP-N-acetylglucosamine 1-carboxyvinyltransferase [Gammaproteobacteria bacterium]HPQ86574.1 UDP-N-acetylglucosamine 1-carboxyvinyltransferase [Gammaproteobacteria bacterium]
MEKIVIKGGKALNGTVTASGAKNAVLPIIAASIVGSGTSIIKNVPHLEDVTTMNELLIQMGVDLTINDTTNIEICADHITNPKAPYEIVKTMRASILALGPLLTKYGRAEVSLPGGCAIGARPVDIHLKGLEAMGAEIHVENGYIIAKADRLKGCQYYMDKVTVTGTENLLIAATLAEGETILENCATEPEVVDLTKYLLNMGAKIEGIGTSVLKITGVDKLYGCEHVVIPDRIEIGTFLVAAAATGGKITVNKVVPHDLESVLIKLRESGAEITVTEDSVSLNMHGERPKPVNINTAPHPAFPTDMQAQFCSLNAIASGYSIVTENLFENRFMHINELVRMGADITVSHNQAVIHGVERLNGAPTTATDLRASASLVIAGLVAEGISEIYDIHFIDRGYEVIEEKLSQLGADIKRVSY